MTTEPVLCEHVNMLADHLGLDASEQRWLFIRHGAITRNHYGLPVKSIPAALLTRLLWRHPGLNPLPVAPEPGDLIEILTPYWQRREGRPMSARKLALITGNASWSGPRWQRGTSQAPAPTNRRLFLVIAELIDSSGDAGIDVLLRVLDEEARVRGHGDFEHVCGVGRWNTDPVVTDAAVRRGDIDQFVLTLNLDHNDYRWLFLSHGSTSRGSGASEPVRSVAMSIMTRLLQARPDVCPVPTKPDPAEMVERLNEPWRAVYATRFSTRKLSMVTGNASWSGARWMRGGTRPNSVVMNLMSVLDILVETYEQRAFEIMGEVLDDEARSRGHADFASVMAAGSWQGGEDALRAEVA